MLGGCSSAPVVATVLVFLTCLTTFNRDRIASTLVQRPAVQPSNQTLSDQIDVPAPKPTHAPYVDSSLEYSKLYRGICVPEEKKCRVPARNASAIAARPACTPGGPSGWDRAGRWYKGHDGHYSWEPSRCRLRRLTAAQARQCLNRKKLVFIGDSISRYMYSSLVHFLSREVWPERYGGQKGARSVVIGREFTVGHPGPDVWPRMYKFTSQLFSEASDGRAWESCDCERNVKEERVFHLDSFPVRGDLEAPAAAGGSDGNSSSSGGSDGSGSSIGSNSGGGGGGSSSSGSSIGSNGSGSSVLWPVQYVLDRVLRQQRQAPERQGGSAAQQAASLTQAKAGAPPAAALQRSNSPGQLPAAEPAALSNGNGSGTGSTDGAQGQKQGHEGRSEEELIAAADWQLQRAHAQLRRAAEAEARQGERHLDSGAAQPDPLSAEEDLLHAEAAHRLPDASASADSRSGSAATQTAPEGAASAAPGQQQADGRQGARKGREKGTGVATWIRLPHMPSLRVTRPPRPDLPPVPISHPAVQLAWRRAKAGSRPGQRTDNAKLGLVVEGGGMRGVISAGSLMMLYELGLRDAFDAVYGASAGAINATYFLTGQRDGVDIYAEDIANKTFCDLGRLVGRNAGPVLDLSFLIDHVMMDIKPLHWGNVISSDVPLKVVASCLDTLGPVVLQDFADKEDLALCLKASANIPVIAGPPMRHRGRRLVDGAVFEAVPFRQAIADGCTHLVVLCTRPPFRGGRLQKTVSSALEAGVKRGFLNPDYMRPAWRAELDQITEQQMTADEQLMGAIESAAPHELPAFFGAYVAPLYPSQACHISPVCIDSPTLRGGMAEGRRLAAATFDPQDLGIPQEVKARLRSEVRAAIERAGPQPSPYSQQPPQ